MEEKRISYMPVMTYSELIQTLKTEFVKAREKGLKGSAGTNQVFNQVQYRMHLNNGHYSQCIESGIDMLLEMQRIDPEFTQLVHKGTPYYWMGISAFLSHDYNSATHFITQAAIEDIRDGSKPVINSAKKIDGASPALLFVFLDTENLSQAALELTRMTSSIIHGLINKYNEIEPRDPFDLLEMRHKLLFPAISTRYNWISLANSFIAFFLEYQHKKGIIYLKVNHSYPMNSIYFSHLMKGCVVLESLLKNNPIHPPQPPENGTYTTLERDLNQLKDLLNIEGNFQGACTFEELIEIVKCSTHRTMSEHFEIARKVRNTLLHNLSWSIRLEEKEYRRLFEAITYSCFHSIKMLYPINIWER